MKTMLLIDGKNTSYRSLFVDNSPNHPFVNWMRLSTSWLHTFKPDSVHMFWDCPRKEVWRRRVLLEYKESRNTMTHINDDKIINGLRLISQAAKVLLPHMGFKQYSVDKQECDDLIYAACRVINPDNKVIIVSSDKDFAQIKYHMRHVDCYDPVKNKFVDMPSVDPVMQKALVGDKSDNIDGYRGIGKVKSGKMLLEHKMLLEFLQASGDHIFKRNLALIDMGLNPYLLSNMLYIIDILANETTISDQAKITELAMKYKVRGLLGEYGTLVTPYLNLHKQK